MSEAIEDLKHEHEAIISSLEILDQITASIAKGAKPEKSDLSNFMGFLKEFADKCHHGKEEGILFPALTQAGMPEKGGPIEVMLSEHMQGRNFIKEMEHAIAIGPDHRAFADAATKYSLLLVNHIQKENNVLFPMAERTLDKNRLEQIYRAFEEHEEKVIGHGRHEELHRILKELKARYPK